jgi:hypothetical protein
MVVAIVGAPVLVHQPSKGIIKRHFGQQCRIFIPRHTCQRTFVTTTSMPTGANTLNTLTTHMRSETRLCPLAGEDHTQRGYHSLLEKMANARFGVVLKN